MGFRLRKSIGLGAGFRLNVSRRGVGLSGGVRGARVSVNSKGRVTRTLSVPGTGISHVTTLGGPMSNPTEQVQPPVWDTPSTTGGGTSMPSGPAAWVKRHKIVAGVGALVFAVGLGSALGGGDPATPGTTASLLSTGTEAPAAEPVGEPEVAPAVPVAAAPVVAATKPVTVAPKPAPVPVKTAPPAAIAVVPAPAAPPAEENDPRYRTCKEAKAHGYGPYRRGEDPEYEWYRDGDSDGVNCE